MSGTWCLCTEGLRTGDLMSKNVDVIECSRLSPAVRKRATDLTAGLRFHASVPLRFRDKPLGIMNVTGPSWRKLTGEELGLLSTIALQVGAMIERSRLAEDEARLARAEERTRLARELHDTLLQSLTAIALQLEASASSPTMPEAMRERLNHTIEDARTAAAEARRAVSDLRAATLAGKPLSQALRGLARGFMSETGVAVTVDASSDVPLSAKAEAELYRIAQEALTNVGKHARAKSVAINLRRTKGAVELTISDDGVGISRTTPADGHGLQGMMERAALLGGTLSIRKRRPTGTKVTASFPTSPASNHLQGP